MKEGAPVFVKIKDYKDVLEVVELINGKLKQAKNALREINELKKEEDSELELWGATLDELGEKVNKIDSVLFEPEGMG